MRFMSYNTTERIIPQKNILKEGLHMDKEKIHEDSEKQLHREQLPTDKSVSPDEILSEEELDKVSGGIGDFKMNPWLACSGL